MTTPREQIDLESDLEHIPWQGVRLGRVPNFSSAPLQQYTASQGPNP